MRWTRELRLTCVAQTYGEVVWFGRRGAGAKRAIRSAGDGGKRAVLREEHEVSRKAIAQGRPGCSRCPVCSCAVLFAQIARETAGAASTRSSLRPLNSGGPNEMQTSGELRRENAQARSAVIASAAKQSMSQHKERMDCVAALAMTWIGCSALDSLPVPVSSES